MTDSITSFQKRHSQRVLLTVSVFGFAAIVIVAGIIVVRNEAAAHYESRIQQSQLMVDLNAVANLSSQKKEAAALAEKLNAALPPALDIPTKVLPRLRTVAAAQGVRLDLRLTTTRDDLNQGFTGLGFAARADGGLRDVTEFLRQIETQPSVITVSDWTITPEGGGAFQLGVNGFIYAQSAQ